MKDRDLEYFLLKNQSIENALIKLQKRGYDIGYAEQAIESPVDPELFPRKIRHEAKKMSNFYIVYYCMENSIRQLIEQVLSEKDSNWWNNMIPEDVKTRALKHRQEEEDLGMETSDELLEYTEFGDLITILEKNAKHFDIINNMRSAKSKLIGFIKSRNIVAHCRMLSDDERDRFELIVKDWLRIVG